MPVRVPYFRALVALLTTTACALALPAAGNATSWSTPALVSASDANAQNTTVAVGDDGSISAFWSQQNFDDDHAGWAIVTATKLPSSETWSTPVAISRAGEVVNVQRIATTTAPDGTITAAWQEHASSADNIVSAARPAGSTDWGPARQVSGSATGGDVALSARPDGSVVAIWATYYGGNSMSASVRAADVNGEWDTNRVEIATDTDGDLDNDSFQEPTLVTDDAGITTAVFTRRIGGASVATITSRQLPAGGTTVWDAAQVVEALSVGSYWIDTDAAPNGDLTAVYSVDAHSGDGPDIAHAATRLAGTHDWVVGELETAGNAFGPQVVIDESGNATAYWMNISNGNEYSEYASTRTPTGSWLAPRRISPEGQMTAYGEAFLTGADQITALWLFSADLQVFGIQSTVRDSLNGDFSPTVEIASNARVQDGPADFDGNRSGDLAVAWIDGVHPGQVLVSMADGNYTPSARVVDQPPANTQTETTTEQPPPSTDAPKPIIEALLVGKKIKLNAAVTAKRCSGRASVVVKVGKTSYGVKLPLRKVTRGAKRVCVVSGTIGLPKAPRPGVKTSVKVSGKQLKSRTLTATR